MNNRLEMFLTLNAEAFKQGLSAAGTSVRTMATGTSAAFTQTKARLQENLVAVKSYNTELREQSGIVQTLKGHVAALVGAYLGFQSIAGITGLMQAADSAAFSLEASLRAANREFSNIGSAESWTAAIGRMAGELQIYSKSELKTAVASTIDMTKRLGFSAEQMEVLITRTADLSAGKTDLNGGIERVTAAMRGEAEASEYLGLTLNENYVKAWHEAHNAHNIAWKDLTDLEKAQVRFNVFLEQAVPLTGKAADSVKTMAGAYALAKANIHDAISENESAVEATKQLAMVVAENADRIGELATMLINGATATMQFVLNHKEAIAVVGLLAAGLGTLSFVITTATTVATGLAGAIGLVAKANQLLVAGNFPAWATTAVSLFGQLKGAATALWTALNPVSKLILAFSAGFAVGKWLESFDAVKKGALTIIHWLDLAQLSAQKFWAVISGGDIEAVEKKIAIAKQAYKELIDEINRPKDPIPVPSPTSTPTPQPSPVPQPNIAPQPQPDRQPQPTAPAQQPVEAEPSKNFIDPHTGQPVSDVEQSAIDARNYNKLTEEQLAHRKQRDGGTLSTEDKEIIAQGEKQKEEQEKRDARRQKARAAMESFSFSPDDMKGQLSGMLPGGMMSGAPSVGSIGGKDEREPAEPTEAANDYLEELAQKKKERQETAAAEEQEAADKAAREEEERAEQAAREEEEREKKREERASRRRDRSGDGGEWQKSLEAVKSYEERMQQVAETVAESGRQAAAEWGDAQAAGAEKAKSVFQQYTDKVRTLQNDIAGREKELDDLDNDRGTAESKWRRKAKEAKEYEKAARAAQQAGNLDEALKLSDQAKAAYSGLKGGAGSISDKLGDQAALRGVKASGTLGIDISKAIQQATAKSALTSMPGSDLFGDLSARIRGQLAAVAGGGADKGPAKADGPAKVHELKFAGGSMRGGEADVEALLNLLAQAGMSAG